VRDVPVTLKELQDGYLAELQESRSPSTLRLNRRWLEGYREFCAARGVQEPPGMTSQLLADYHQSLLESRRYSLNSLRQMLHMLRSFLRWAYARGHLTSDLGALVGPLRPSHLTYLTESELAHLYAVAKASANPALGLRDVALVAVFYEGKLSAEEAHRLDLADVALPERSLLGQFVRDSLAQALADYLERARPALHPQEGETAVFLSRTGRRLGVHALSVRLRALGVEAGLSSTLSPRRLALSGQAHRSQGR